MVKYSNHNRTLVYSKGMSKDDVLSSLRSRVAKRKKEIDKREWIVKEYDSLLAKQKLDNSWIKSIELGNVRFD